MVGKWTRRSNRERWEETARALGLRVHPPGFLRKGVLSGELRGLPVSARSAGSGQVPGIELTVGLLDAPAAELRISPQVLLRTRGDVELGDEPFDRAFVVHGDRRIVFATLSHSVRRAWCASADTWRWTLTRGELRARTGRIEEVAGVLQGMVELADRMRYPDDAPYARLLENLRSEAELRVAMATLELLLEAPPELRAAALDLGLRARAGWGALRLRAAEAQPGPEAREALAALAAQREEEDALRLRAFQTWSAQGGVTPEAAQALVAGAGPKLLLGVIRVLSRLGAGEQSQLLGWLGHPAIEVRIAAASALGACGDRWAIQPLQEVKKGLRSSGELRDAANVAIARIQSRLGPAEAGRLSVTTGEARGELSVAETPGALSVDDEE